MELVIQNENGQIETDVEIQKWNRDTIGNAVFEPQIKQERLKVWKSESYSKLTNIISISHSLIRTTIRGVRLTLHDPWNFLTVLRKTKMK